MKKGFSLIELLVVIAIIAIILSFGIPWSINYIVKKRIEKDTNTIYLALKQAQIEAKLKKQSFCITLEDNYTLVIKNDVIKNNTCSGKVIKSLALEVPFNINATLGKHYFKINQFGIFTIGGSIYYSSTSIDTIDCVKADEIRVCEGYWDASNSDCICKY